MSSILPARHGFTWHHSEESPGLLTPPLIRKVVASAYASPIFVGDVVKSVNDGTVALTATTDGPGWVVAAVERYKNPGDGLVRSGPYLPSSAALTYTGSASLDNPFASVLVCIPVRGQIFEVNCANTGTSWATAQTYVGEYMTFVQTASGDTVTGISGMDLSPSTHSTTATNLQWALMAIPVYGLGQNNMNDPSGTTWRALVRAISANITDVGT